MTPLDVASTHEFHDGILWYVRSYHATAIISIAYLSLFGLEPVVCASKWDKWKPKHEEMNIYASTEKSLELMYLFNPPKTS